MKKTIGILSLQGAYREHISAIKRIGSYPVEIREKEQLRDIDGLIIPGGESTTISKLMAKYGFITALKSFNKPIFGTCAGTILLAKDVPKLDEPTLQLMDITVDRNAYGRQIDSFEEEINIAVKNQESRVKFHAIFIRAPKIVSIGKDVEILAKCKDEPVLVRQGDYLASTFHPELTEDYRIHRMFIKMIESRIKSQESRV